MVRKPLRVVLGAVLVLAGIVWTLQGIDVLKGSSMSGTTTWAVIGPIVLVLGVVLASVGLRGPKR